jgi:YVTN family beta-propeller protein
MRFAVVIAFVCACCVRAAAAPALYVSCEDDGRIGVIDTTSGRQIAAFPAGKRPRGLRLAPDGTRLWVALSGSPKGGPGVDEASLPPRDAAADGIGEIELGLGRLVRVLPSGRDPETFDVSADGRELFVSNEESAQASIVDALNGRVREAIGVGGEPEGVRVRPDGKVVYVTSEADGAVFVIDTRRSKVIARIAVPARPRVVVFSHDGRFAYVSSENGGRVTVIDARRHVAAGAIRIPNDGVRGPMGARPMGLALTAAGTTLYVANGRGGTVSVVDTVTQKVVRTITGVGARPWGIAWVAGVNRVYTANGPSDDVSVIDPERGVVQRIPACGSPWGITVRP